MDTKTTITTVIPGPSHPLRWHLVSVYQYTSLAQASGEFIQRLAVQTAVIVYEYLEPSPLWSLSHINSAQKFAF